ncbi:type II secretion system protein [Microcoleus sp. FACHB-1515]|uniref:type IV pilus modification PilV family protein n=1 Tax=Cyanophyceae TaxID=3028117 RepID=UPI001681DC88|nr:type II secretion system protein [Microcoleus sp. FACHB-1515]MBD2091368.1 type II secretion system protein [Microcoleus sp. FACHB-1515]
MNTSSRWHRLALSLSSRKPAEMTQGLTLVECIMAIVVIALTSAMITPPLFIAAATRMQNQRAEQAMQIAQGEVDRIRALVEWAEHTPDRLPTPSQSNPIGATPPPTSLSSIQSKDTACNTYSDEQRLPVATAFGVDTTDDGNCQPDFAVQMFRSNPPEPVPGEQRGRPGTFCLVVRVYGKPAINEAGDGFVGQLETAPASLRFTTGEGNQRTRPLAVITTPMIWSDRSFSSREIRLNSNGICR